jgi:type II secretory pathway predicted ATPase ExeA
MNHTLFGLSKMPFTALPAGSEVFIGPQTAGLVAALGSALAPRDAVAVVSGGAGTGKTTLVNYALNALYKKKKVVRVGRSPLEPQNVLQSLLIVLGVENRPSDREQRLVILRDALRQYASAGISVIVVVEDALTAGVEVLAEIAALTATEDGETGGARIVLMGVNSLSDFLQCSELADLSGRIALQHELHALNAAETRGYLLHCFRNAGGDFDQLFQPDCSALLHKICDGNPRAINQLAEVVLRTAAEMGLQKISARYIAEVAVQIYDPESHDFRFVTRDTDAEAQNDQSVDAAAADGRTEAVEEDIARAECLEDLDDVSAETLFGADLSEVAAQATGGNN